MYKCRYECTLYSCSVCDIYKVSALANLSDSVYTNYRNIGPSESPGFGRYIYIYTKYWCECTYVCPVFNRQRADDALALVFVRRASVAERFTRELGGAAKLRGRIMRCDWSRNSATRGACR